MYLRNSLAVLALAAAPLALAAPAQADTVNFNLDQLNNSGASAQATITTNADGGMTVDITGSGFTPNSPHAQHIHGSAESREFFCPSPDTDDNGDGQIATEEAVEEYGDVMVSLTTTGDASADSGLAVERMPVADAEGNLEYSRTIPASMIPEGLVDNIENLHIVQHGIDVNGNGEYDLEALGESVFAESLGVQDIPEEATNPATCGEVSPIGGVETGAGSTQGTEASPLLALGGLSLVGAAGALLLRRRYAAAQH